MTPLGNISFIPPASQIIFTTITKVAHAFYTAEGVKPAPRVPTLPAPQTLNQRNLRPGGSNASIGGENGDKKGSMGSSENFAKKITEIKSKVKGEAEKRIRPKKEPKVVEDVTIYYRLITREELDRAE